jgi:hypothetical protein
LDKQNEILVVERKRLMRKVALFDSVS